jgi:hypothetical protein
MVSLILLATIATVYSIAKPQAPKRPLTVQFEQVEDKA